MSLIPGRYPLTGVRAATTAPHQTFTGADFHPYWEGASVLEHGASHWTPTDVSQAEKRLEAALAITGQLPRRR